MGQHHGKHDVLEGNKSKIPMNNVADDRKAKSERAKTFRQNPLPFILYEGQFFILEVLEIWNRFLSTSVYTSAFGT